MNRPPSPPQPLHNHPSLPGHFAFRFCHPHQPPPSTTHGQERNDPAPQRRRAPICGAVLQWPLNRQRHRPRSYPAPPARSRRGSKAHQSCEKTLQTRSSCASQFAAIPKPRTPASLPESHSSCTPKRASHSHCDGAVRSLPFAGTVTPIPPSALRPPHTLCHRPSSAERPRPKFHCQKPSLHLP